MPQIEKVTRKLTLNNTAEFSGFRTVPVTGNYAIPNNASGSTFVVSNSGGIVSLFLPPVNGFGGRYFNIIGANIAAGLNLVGDTNAIFSEVSVNATHYVKSVHAGNNGAFFSLRGNGTAYFLYSSNVLNVRSYTEA